MTTTDQRWAIAALAALALCLGTVAASAPPAESEWLRMPDAVALQPVAVAPLSAQLQAGELERALPQAGEEAMLVNALYVIPDREVSPQRTSHLRM